MKQDKSECGSLWKKYPSPPDMFPLWRFQSGFVEACDIRARKPKPNTHLFLSSFLASQKFVMAAATGERQYSTTGPIPRSRKSAFSSPLLASVCSLVTAANMRKVDVDLRLPCFAIFFSSSLGCGISASLLALGCSNITRLGISYVRFCEVLMIS